MIAENSRALQLVQSQGWTFKENGDNLELETCPFCKKTGYGHFYMRADGTNGDGLYSCHRCGVTGNGRTLREHLGLAIAGVVTPSDWSRGGEREQEPLPDVQVLHEALLADIDAMEYLVSQRGFSREIIEKAKLGLTRRNFRGIGEVRALVYPYLVQGNCVFVHFRTLPPAEKAFSSPKGWDAPLYNGEIIREGLKELILVEGEANCIAAMDKGVQNIVGVPGANFKKALWIEQLDKIAPERIYICYDKDKVGQKAAQTLASKIGIERCYKICLPTFSIPSESGERTGKDLNEWFLFGQGSAERFEELKQEAQLFDVQGVSNTQSALDELEDFFSGKTSVKPTYDTPWKDVNDYVGFEDGDVIDLVAPEKIGKTTVGMNMMEHAVEKYGEDGVIICLEMTVLRLSKKWVSHVTHTPDIIPKNEEADKFILQSFRNAIPEARTKAANRPGTLYFCYPQYKTVDDIYKLIKDCIRRYGVKWVMIDNLQRLCDTTLVNQNRTIHLSQISKVLSQIAKDYNIKMIRILQPHRIGDGRIITTDNVDGASQIAKDCDAMITIHRKSMFADMTQKDLDDLGPDFKREESFESKTTFTVGLSRYSGGGTVTLEFDGATSTLMDRNAVKQAMQVPVLMGEAVTV
jgi:replicative DNA helicase